MSNAARTRGSKKRIVATPIAAKPISNPTTRHSRNDGLKSDRTTRQTTSQNTKTNRLVGMRMAV